MSRAFHQRPLRGLPGVILALPTVASPLVADAVVAGVEAAFEASGVPVLDPSAAAPLNVPALFLTVGLTDSDTAARRAYSVRVELLQRISLPWSSWAADDEPTWAIVWTSSSFGIFDGSMGNEDDLRDGLSSALASHLALFAADWKAVQQAAALIRQNWS